MKTMDSLLDNYLRMRRRLGYDLAFTERVLRRFAEFADATGAAHIDTDLFLRWKAHYGSADNATWAGRLTMVRGFARWLHGTDPRHEVPPAGLVAGKLRRTRPYIYDNGQIADIVAEATRLPSPYGLRGRTYATLFGLIAVTGLRIGEAVPVTACTRDKLGAYREECVRLLGLTPRSFFRLEGGRPPSDCAARYTFAKVCQRIGLRDPQRFHRHGRGPRIHDLRHTFAVQTIIDGYRRGLDVDLEMARLSIYLGHASPESTYWYMEAVPELLHLAAERAADSIPGGRS
jgi:integrase